MKYTKDNPLYIGDGVYVYDDGFHLVLQTNMDARERTWSKVYLDSHVRKALYDILKTEFREDV